MTPTAFLASPISSLVLGVDPTARLAPLFSRHVRHLIPDLLALGHRRGHDDAPL